MAQEALKKNNNSVQDEWGQVCSQLKMEFGETAFDSWLKPLQIGAYLCADRFYEKLGFNALLGSNP